MIDKETKELCKGLAQIAKNIDELNKTIKSLSLLTANTNYIFSAELMTEECRRISEVYRKSIEEKTSPINSE